MQMPSLTNKLSIDTQSMLPFMLEATDALAAHFASLNSVNDQHNIEQKEPKAMTNLTELLLITFVFVMGHLQLAASEYHAYNERLSLGRTGNGRMTWCFGFSAFALMIVLLCLGFTHGTHHHSAGAIIALSFYLVNLAIDLLGSFVVVFLTNKDGIIRDVNHSGLNSEDAAYAAKKCIVKGGGTGLFSKLHLEKGMDFYVQSWYWHMYQLVTWNNIRVVGALSARWAIIVCILTTQVFDKKGQVVY
jgi:hypothetical protein